MEDEDVNFYDVFEEIVQDAGDDIVLKLKTLISKKRTVAKRLDDARDLFDILENVVDMESRYRNL
jgi:hypothetical protein